MKRILVAGHVQSNFIKQLYGSIQNLVNSELQFDTVELKELSGKDEYGGSKVFGYNYTLSDIKIRSVFSVFSLKFSKLFFLFVFFKTVNPKVLINLLKKYLQAHTLYHYHIKGKYDFVHFHYPTFSNLYLLWHLEKKEKIILSFWGSDLLRTSDTYNFIIQTKAVKHANLITTQSTELVEIILAKFGRKYKSKIKQTLFPPNDDLYHRIEQMLSEDSALNAFLNQFQIHAGKYIIAIGHNANEYNNHTHIINELISLPNQIKDQIFCVFPFTYGNLNKITYQENLEKQLQETNISYCFLNDFLTWEQLAALKIKSAITIHLPESDALSGAVTESMYAGSVLITGAWLPYSPFKKAGLHYETIENIAELNIKIIDIVEHYDRYKIQISKNRNIIKNNFLSERTATTWLPIYA